MNKRLLRKILLVLPLLVSVSVITTIRADDDDEDEEHEREEHQSRESQKARNETNKNVDLSRSIPTSINQKYKAECASCHMLYPPGLLPQRSWVKMMTGLSNHFGESAEIDAQTQKEVTDYLTQNASDVAPTRRGQKILGTIGKDESPLRISETNYFKRKHHELSSQVYKRTGIGSAANCIACHPGAESGNFEEEDVRIPKEVKK